MCAKKLISH